MRSWLTTHHPHLHPDDDAGWNIYVRERPNLEPAVGDQVTFYETLHVPAGSGLRPGRRGLVRTAEVAGAAQSSDVDGWPIMYPCSAHRRLTAVLPMEQVLAVLKRGNIRIRGGLVELSPEQQNRLRPLIG